MKRYQAWLYKIMVVILGTILSLPALASEDEPVGKARVVSSSVEQVASRESAPVQRQQALDRTPTRDPFQPIALAPEFEVCFTGAGSEEATEAFLNHARELGQPVRVMARGCALEVMMAVGRDYVSATFIVHSVDGDEVAWMQRKPLTQVKTVGLGQAQVNAIACLIPTVMVELQRVATFGVYRKERPKTRVAVSVNLGGRQSYGGRGGHGPGLGVSVGNDRYRVSVSTGSSGGRGGYTQSSRGGGPRYTSSLGGSHRTSSGRGGRR